jgi:hypothetical protein
VLERDELEHLGVVAARLEQERAHAVGHHLGFLAEVDAVAKQPREQARPRDPRAQLLVAARRADQDPGAGAQAKIDRVIGGGVARVQRDHHVHRRRRDAAQIALDEGQADAAGTLGDAVAQRDQVGAQLDADDPRHAAEAAAQMLVHGEGQVALAAAVVDDADRLGADRRRRGQRVERVIEDLEELLDLAPLARHRRHQPMRAVGDPELGPERQIERQPSFARAVVRRHGDALPPGVVDVRRRPLVPSQRDLALLADEQLRVAAGRVQRRVREGRRAERIDEGRDRGDAFVDRLVGRDVARRMGGDERQRPLALQRDEANADRLRLAARGAILGENERLERSVVDARAQRGKERGERRRTGRWRGRR